MLLLVVCRKSWSNVPILCGERSARAEFAGDAKSNSLPNMELRAQPGWTSEDTMIAAVQDLKLR